MALDIRTIRDRVVSHAMTTGWFETVNQTKVDEPAGAGLTAAVWADDLKAVRSSGLASVSVLVVFKLRIYSNTESQPEAAIDDDIVDATSALLNAYAGDFELGGTVRHVDVLGAEGTPLSANAHYMNLSGVIYRVMDIALPLIVNDVWDLSA